MSVEIYSREGCKSCDQVKAVMNYYSIQYTEHKLDVDVTPQRVQELFPGKNALPILVVNGEAYAGAQEASKVLNEYKRELGKQLLSESGYEGWEETGHDDD